MNRIHWYGPSLVLGLTVAAALVLGPGLVQQIAHARVESTRLTHITNLETNTLLQQMSDAYTQVARAVEPSVVHIEVRANTPRHQAQRLPGGLPDDLRRWFFGPPTPEDTPRTPGPQDPHADGFDRYNPPAVTGNGAGWVYDTQGHIITNHHVVAHADQITVRLFDGDEREATVIGSDARTDIAVLKVDPANLHPAVISADPVEQGEVVFAFGSPFRFEFSMSQGIVSAKGRQLSVPGSGKFEKFIQTDAEINPGNSGGPLVDITGKVIGMNTAIASRNGQFNGLGFAIPAPLVQRIADQLIDQGAVHRGYLGVYIEDLSPEMARTFGYDGAGVLVRDTIPGSPAEKAGLASGDIITHVNGKPVEGADALRFLIAGLGPDTGVTLTVFRDGGPTELTVTLTELPDPRTARAPGRTGGPAGGDDPDAHSRYADADDALRKLGVTGYQTLTDDEAAQLGWSPAPGVAVTDVRPRSIAANEGLIPGTLITQVMTTDVATAADLLEALDAADLSQPVRLTTARWDKQSQRYVKGYTVVHFPQN